MTTETEQSVQLRMAMAEAIVESIAYAASTYSEGDDAENLAIWLTLIAAAARDAARLLREDVACNQEGGTP